MKKFKYLLFFTLFLGLVSTSFADSWDDFSNVDKMWDGQKTITNQDFENVVEKLEEKSKQSEEKQKKKKRKKIFGSGTTLHEELNPDNNIKELESLMEEEDLVVNIPVKLLVNNVVLEKGFYKVLPEVDSESRKKYISLYQSQYLKCKIEIVETKDDFNEQELSFVKLMPYNESFVKIIFGSLNFNGYAFVPYIE